MIFLCALRGIPKCFIRGNGTAPRYFIRYCHGPNEIIKNKFSGILVVDNQPTALATGLDEMIDNLEHYLSNVKRMLSF